MAVSEKEIGRRCGAIREKMKEEGMKALVVFSRDQWEHAGAVRYISNSAVITRKEYLILPISGDPIQIKPKMGEIKGMVGEVAEAIRALKLKDEVLGIFGLIDAIPYNDYQLLIQELPKAKFKDATELLNAIRWVKSPEEIALVQEATEIADRCYTKLLEILRVGKNEREVMGEIYAILGAHLVKDILILTAKGPNPPRINLPGSYTFKSGDHYILSVELAGPSGYWTQIARFVCLQQTTPQYERIFKVAKAALQAGASNLVPGKRIGELVSAITGKVEAEGYVTEYWCGHAMGLDLGDGLGLSKDSIVELKEGMVFTLHPYISSRNGQEKMFIADTFVVGKEGGKNFSRSLQNIECL